MKNFHLESRNIFFRLNNQVSFIMPFNDTIYSIAYDSIFPRFYIDFGENKIPFDIFQKTSSDYLEQAQLRKKALTEISKDNFAFNANNFSETNYSIFFQFRHLLSSHVFYSKSTDKIVIAKNLINDIDHIPYTPPIAATDSEFVSIIEPADIIEHYKKIKNKYPESELKTIKQLVDSITEFDNPILVFAKTKPF